MVILFEDNEESSISQLLKKIYTYRDDVTLLFASGNMNVEECISKLGNSERAIVYLDVIPDKLETVEVYNNCMKYINDNNLDNIVLIAIPCIEYYVIKAFFKKEYKEVMCVNKCLNYKSIERNYRNKLLSIRDFEKYCKSVVANYKDCFKEGGWFYTVDCICKKGVIIDDCVEYKVEDKASKLECMLPIISQEKIVRDDYKREMIQNLSDYYEVADRFVEYGIIGEVPKLLECKFV
jgi:hypothetical protein